MVGFGKVSLVVCYNSSMPNHKVWVPKTPCLEPEEGLSLFSMVIKHGDWIGMSSKEKSESADMSLAGSWSRVARAEAGGEAEK